MEVLTLVIFLCLVSNIGFWLTHYRCIYMFVYEFIDNEIPKTFINDKYIKNLNEITRYYILILSFLLGIYILSTVICIVITNLHKLIFLPLALFMICTIIIVYFVNKSYKKYKIECLFVYKHYVTESKVKRLRRKRK